MSSMAATYAETAYRSNRRPLPMDETNQQGVVFRRSWMMGVPLSKGKLCYLCPPEFLETWGPAEVDEDDKAVEGFKKEEAMGGEPFNPVGWIDGLSIRYATLPKTSWALLWMQHGGRLVFLFLFPIFVLAFLFVWSQEPDRTTFALFFWDGVFPVLAYFFLPLLLCWGIGRFLEKRFPHWVYQPPKGPLWELNRRTGLVTLFENPNEPEQSGQIRAQAPFHEWEGYLLSLPDHQGNLWHRLALVHKTREWALPLNQLIGATTNKEDVLAYWDLIRQYMDVTKPLPDIPLFEPYRELDATTNAHDDKKERAARYWRDMDENTYEAFKRDNWTRLQRYRWA